MSEITIVTENEAAKKICIWVEKNCHLISFDIEGENLGRDGVITLLQIGVNDKSVICFDILALGDQEVFENLKPIFESKRICKLCYDCRTDGDVLKSKYGVQLNCVYDIQVLYTFLFQKEGDPFLKGLHHALQEPGIVRPESTKKVMLQKKKIKESLQKIGSQIFLERPIPENVLMYCVSDVVYLYKMFYHWHHLVDFRVVLQASMYRLYKFCNRKQSKKMYYVDFKQMPLLGALIS
jgi:hypothetical protein